MPNHMNQDFCKGDQGGPLVCAIGSPRNVVLVGIITEFVNCGKYLPGLYTNIVPYLSWITKEMGHQQSNSDVSPTTSKFDSLFNGDFFQNNDDFFQNWLDSYKKGK